jgi:hypothetical protein
MAPQIFRVIFHQRSFSDYAPNFSRRDHPLRSEHLPYRVEKIKNLFPGRQANAREDLHPIQHIVIVIV